jgi:hypothetical protein
MPNQYARARERAFCRQDSFCFYCSQPMWLIEPELFAKRYGLRPRQVRSFQCTAEHRVERHKGGKGGANILAACRHCNTCRHRGRQDRAPSTNAWRIQVREWVSKGRWRTLKPKVVRE